LPDPGGTQLRHAKFDKNVIKFAESFIIILFFVSAISPLFLLNIYFAVLRQINPDLSLSPQTGRQQNEHASGMASASGHDNSGRRRQRRHGDTGSHADQRPHHAAGRPL
jgi:hypothetical protein